MDPTCGLAEKFRDIVLDQIWEQLLYLIYYHRNVEELNELPLRRRSIQDDIDEATNNGEQIKAEVLECLLKVDKIFEEQVPQFHEEESQANTDCSLTSCPNLWLRYQLSKRAKTMTQEVADIYEKIRNIGTLANVVPPQQTLEPTMEESNEGIDSRVPIMNEIMEALRDASVNMIGLCGLGGVGKTTIAKEVAHKGKNGGMFEKVIMVRVPHELIVKSIQNEIAETLGMQIKETTDKLRAGRLRERLNKEKSMLLILDDLWVPLDLAAVGIPFIEGCKILLTSRDETLLSNLMNCKKIIKVGVLSDKEAWELFKRIAELSIDSSSHELRSVATKIVQKCGGLPLAIATAARFLRNKDLRAYKDALSRLNNPLRRNNTLTNVMDIAVKLSYDGLSSTEYKHMFLLAAMLSHDPSIEDLLMYSVGLDILKHVENMEEAHDGVSTIVRKLKSLNLFLDSYDYHHFTMHDVTRDVALGIASDEPLHAFISRHRSLTEWPDENKLEGYKGIFLHESDIVCDFPEELHGPTRLEFFLLNNKTSDLTIPRKFFESSKELKVLWFSNVHFPTLPSLSSLRKLKALCLHSCLLEDITEVISLKGLKILSFAYSEIERLPNELAKLSSLQMLNLSHCSKLKVIPQKLLSSFKKLEVLYLGNSFHQWKVEGSSEGNDNASLNELKDLPISSLEIHIPNVSILGENFSGMNLERYKIFIGKRWKLQGNYKTSKVLKLELESNIHFMPGVPKLLTGVEDLHLYGSNGDFRPVVFDNQVLLPKLEILELSNLNNSITSIWDDQLSHNSFRNVKTFIVESCGFVKLVPVHVLKCLNNLEELEVRDCHMLEVVFDFEDLNNHKLMESSSGAVPLKRLILRNLPKLENVWSGHHKENVSFKSLSKIRVSFCKSLKSMFPASIAKGMLHDLEELRIANCGMEVIVGNDEIPEESVPLAFMIPRLTSLELSGLSKLNNFYPRRHTLECTNLRRLLICDCHGLEIFDKKVSNDSLEIREEESTQGSKYPILSHHKGIDDLEELRLWGEDARMIASGELPMYRFPKVKFLYLNGATSNILSLCKSFPNLEELQLWSISLGAFQEDDVGALAATFSKLTLGNIYYQKIGLTPSLVSSPNHLTHLHIQSSDYLPTLMTPSIARSLVHLTYLSVGFCRSIREIMTKEQGENDEDKTIFFNKLQVLKLYNLPNLKRFCGHDYTFRFPLLSQLILIQCLEFKIFCPGPIDTPSIISVRHLQDWVKGQHFWDTNINKTIYQQRLSESEVVLDEDDASMIRNGQFPADPCPQVENLLIHRFGDDWETLPNTLVKIFLKLNELHVKYSSFKVIFTSHIVDQIPASQLANLTVLKVSECHQLIYLMTNSTAKSLVNLKTLEINRCKKMEGIVTKEANEDVEEGITFNGLRILKLTDLSRLKRFCGHCYTFRFPLLDQVIIKECPKFKTFSPGLIYAPFLKHVEAGISQIWDTDLNQTIYQQRFWGSRVAVLDEYDANIIRNGLFPANRFPKVEDLHIEKFVDEGVTFPHTLLERFPNLEALHVEHCSFEEIFPSQIFQIVNFEILFISYLDELKSIWKDDSQLPPIHQNLTHLEVKSCRNLLKLAPSSASFQLLMWLNVSGCDQLIHLVTTSTARSLVSLKTLEINDCNKMEQIIVMNEANEDVQAAIKFNQLWRIKLIDMPNLKMFSSQSYAFKFPELEEIEITRCPQVKKLCAGGLETPKLCTVKIEGQDMEWKDEGDLNTTIQMLSSPKDSLTI